MTDEEKNRIAMILVQALRTIASCKKDYGKEVADIEECRAIAREALVATGCLK